MLLTGFMNSKTLILTLFILIDVYFFIPLKKIMYTKRFHLIEFKFIKTYLFYFFNFNKYMNKYFKTKVFINNTIRIEVFIFYIYQKDNDFFKILKHQLI